MNKQYLIENGLYDAHKQFMKLCEWSYSPSALEEEGDDQNDPNAQQNQNGGMGGQDPMGGGMQPPMGDGQQPPMGGGQDMAGGQDPMGGGQQDPMGGGDMGGDASMGSDQQPPMGDDMGGDMPMDEMPPMGEEEEDDVIDVEDLTQAQEKVNDKVNHIGKDLGGVDQTIHKLMSTIDKMETMINQTNDKIESLNQEFQKRIKTPTEKLNLRALDSYPFNVRPTDYWDKVARENPNYQVTADNTAPTGQDEYVIKQKDIDNMNEKDIEHSFIDDEMRQDINKIFGI